MKRKMERNSNVGAALRKGLLAACGAALFSVAAPMTKGADVLDFLQKQAKRDWSGAPRQVLAFYYTWYGTPARHGRWIHWAEVDPEKGEIRTSTHYPALGAYDSHDPKLIDTHIRMAKESGLSGFIATWWGQGTFDDQAFRVLLDRAEAQKFHVTVYWETAPGKGEAQIRRAAADLSYILTNYAARPAFLKLRGKPVIFVYGRTLGQVPYNAWPEIIRRVRARAGDFLLIADRYSEAYARMFDGVHTYNICGKIRGMSLDQVRGWARQAYGKATALARRHRRVSCVTVIPGYDDTKIRRPGLKAERRGGRLYETLWREAVRADPDWILITSWNEWHEGSEIEPSREFGDLYLRLTRRFAPAFLRSAPAKTPAAAAAKPGKEIETIRALFRNRPIGLLPDLGGELPFRLLDWGLKVRALSWEELTQKAPLTAERFPVLLWTGGERYRSSIRKPGDVIAGLQGYLRSGGLLAAVPSEPFPFYYDESQEGAAAPVARRLGLPVAMGWETPPTGRKLFFETVSQRLPGLPKRFPFPAQGDLRWRPANPRFVENGRYIPLIRLKDTDGRDYGDAAALAAFDSGPLRGGRTVYVWMGAPGAAGADRFYAALLRFLGEEANAARP